MALPLAGQIIRASDIRASFYVYKTVTEAAPISSTTPQNDDELFCTLGVGRWEVKFRGHATSTASGINLSTNYTFSGTTTRTSREGFGPGASATDPRAATTFRGTANNFSQQTGFGVGVFGTVGATAIWEDLFLDVSVAGVLQLQFSQTTSSATPVSLTVDSRLIITPLEPMP